MSRSLTGGGKQALVSWPAMLLSVIMLLGAGWSPVAAASTCPGGVSEETTATTHRIICSAADFSISSSVTITKDGAGVFELTALENATADDEFGQDFFLNDTLSDSVCYEFTSTKADTLGAVYSGTVINNVGFTNVVEGACSGGGGPGPGPMPPVPPVVTSATSTADSSYIVSGTHPVNGTIISVVIDADTDGVIDIDEPPATGPVNVAAGVWATAPIAIAETTTYLVVANDPISGLPSDIVSHTVTYTAAPPDTTPPTVLSSVPAASPETSTTVAFTVSFSELVKNITPNDFVAVGTGDVTADITGVSTAVGDVVVVTVSNIRGTGTLAVGLAADRDIVDEAGNLVEAYGGGAVHNVDIPPPDTTPPTVLSSVPAASPETSTTVEFTVSFSELVENITPNDFVAVGSGDVTADITGVSTAIGDVVVVTVSNIRGTGTLAVGLAADRDIADEAGNLVEAYGGGAVHNVDIPPPDTTPPVVLNIQLIGSPAPNATFFAYSIEFDEEIDQISHEDFNVVSAGVSYRFDAESVTGSDTTRTITFFDVSGDGTLQLNVRSNNQIKDTAGNGGGENGFVAPALGPQHNVDTIPPTGTIVIVGNPKPNDKTVYFSAEFDSELVGLDVTDFGLVITGSPTDDAKLPDGDIRLLDVPGKYEIALENIVGTGSIALEIKGGGDIKDLAGNIFQGARSSNLFVDHVAPTATITLLGDPQSDATELNYSVTFNEAVSGVGLNDFQLIKYGTTGDLSFTPIDARNYTLTVSGISGNGELQMVLNASESGIIDGAGIPLDTNVYGAVHKVDMEPPSVQSIAFDTQPAAGATTVFYRVLFNEPVNDVTNAGFELLSEPEGAVTATTINVEPPTSASIGSNYVVKVSGLSGEGDFTLRLIASESGITDYASKRLVDDAAGTLVSFPFKKAQSITFANPGQMNFSYDTITLTALASSTLQVVFTSGTPDVCTVTENGELTHVKAGACAIHADQKGDETYSAAARQSREFSIVATLPQVPKIEEVVAGNASVKITASALDGGAAITSYGVTATSEAEPISWTVNNFPAELTGLTNGTAYTFTVTATNAAGTSAASEPFGPITPAVPNTAPKIANIGDYNIIAGEAITLDLSDYVFDEEQSFATGTLSLAATVTRLSGEAELTSPSVQISGSTLTLITDDSSGGVFSVEVKVTDGIETTTTVFKLTVAADEQVRFICSDNATYELNAYVNEAFEHDLAKCFKNADVFTISSYSWTWRNRPASFEVNIDIDSNNKILTVDTGYPEFSPRDAGLVVNLTIEAENIFTRHKIAIQYVINVLNDEQPEFEAPDIRHIHANGELTLITERMLLDIGEDDDLAAAKRELVKSGSGIPGIVGVQGVAYNPAEPLKLKTGIHFIIWRLTSADGRASVDAEQKIYIWPQLSLTVPTEVRRGADILDAKFTAKFIFGGWLPREGLEYAVTYDPIVEMGVFYVNSGCAGVLTPPPFPKLFNEINTNEVERQLGYDAAGVEENAECAVRLANNYRNIDSQNSTAKLRWVNELSSIRALNAGLTTPQLSGTYSPTLFLNNEGDRNYRQTLASSVGLNQFIGTVSSSASQGLNSLTPSAALSLRQALVQDIELSFEQNENGISLQMPADLTPGVYQISIRYSDENNRQGTTTVLFSLLETLPELDSNIDTDGDGLRDTTEGLYDLNGNGIADYLDTSSVSSQLQLDIGQASIQCQPGTLCALGPYAMAAGGDGAAVSSEQWLALSGTPETDYNPAGAIADFVVRNILTAGESVQVVVPLTQPIAANAHYRLFANEQWRDFTADSQNQLYSAAATSRGVCPSAGAADYRPGLNAGDYCVQILLQDGGPNDADGMANGELYQTSMLALLDNRVPELQPDTLALKFNRSGEINLLSNDVDWDGHTIELIDVRGEARALEFTDDGMVHVTPYDNFVGNMLFEYRVQDQDGAVAESSLLVTVAANQLPDAQNDTAATDDRTSILINVLANDTDADGDSLQLTEVSAEHGSVVIEGNQIRYTAPEGFSGIDNLSYTVSDEWQAESYAGVTVTVQAYETIVVTTKSGGAVSGWWSLGLALLALCRRRVLFVLLASMSSATMAQGWYAQLETGSAQASSPKLPANVEVLQLNKSDWLWAAAVGYQLQSWLDIEAGYIDQGSAGMQLSLDTLTPEQDSEALEKVSPVLAKGATFGVAFTPWQAEGWSVRVPVGVMNWTSDVRGNTTAYAGNIKLDGTDWYAGLELARRTESGWSVGVAYQRYDLAPGAVDTFSLKLRYYFL